jgi:hypothetical protein
VCIITSTHFAAEAYPSNPGPALVLVVGVKNIVSFGQSRMHSGNSLRLSNPCTDACDCRSFFRYSPDGQHLELSDRLHAGECRDTQLLCLRMLMHSATALRPLRGDLPVRDSYIFLQPQGMLAKISMAVYRGRLLTRVTVACHDRPEGCRVRWSNVEGMETQHIRHSLYRKASTWIAIKSGL